MSGDTDLYEFQRRLLAMGAAADAIAKQAAPKVEKAIRESAASGETFAGDTWKLTKREGRKALPGVEKAINTTVNKGMIITKVDAPYSYHHNAKNEAYRRRILPDTSGGMPAKLGRILTDAALEVLGRTHG